MKYKILGYIFIFIILAAIVSVLYYQDVSSRMPDSTGVNHQTGLKTYSNPEYGISVQYAQNYTLQTKLEPVSGSGLDPKGFEANAKPIASIDIPKSLYPNTNFIESYLFIQAARNITEAKCNSFAIEVEKLDKPHDEIIDGITYREISYMGAAAGNIYESKTYRVMHNNICFEINLNLHTGNISNYPKEIKEVNKDEIWTKLGDVLKTFKFSN